jgi:DNA-directed DNA polymerase
MIDVDRALSEQGLSSRVLLQIHDELLVEVASAEVEAVETLLKEQMGGAAELSVPLDVAVGRGRTWREAAH